jgi:hypothetical protein
MNIRESLFNLLIDTDYLSDFTNLKFVRLPGEEEEDPKDELKKCETVTDNLRKERTPEKEQVLKQQIRHLQEELGTIKGYISEKMQKQVLIVFIWKIQSLRYFQGLKNSIF